MARTMTVDVGDELPEEHAEFCLEELLNLLAEGMNIGDPKLWDRGAFPKSVRASAVNERD
ncbi:antitoxin [Lelliottia nimipressuralis]|uniref:antitoxin n=1 Tax=Lelliottia nimipressuralis TaxID=69220 RepID=UPI0028A0BA49|nr:antitoxin [Lelliottia nimipressuralis]